MSAKYHYPDIWVHPHHDETTEQRDWRIHSLVPTRTPYKLPERPSISVRQGPLNWKRPSFRHTTKRRGAGDRLTNNKRVVANRA